MAYFTPLRSAALLAACWASLASAQPRATDTVNDYSHAIPLTVSGKSAVVQVRLPQAVYLNARSADLRDLRVFNANGKALPFALTAPSSKSEASRRELQVTVFPVTNAVSQASTVKNDFEIKTSADGSVTSITTRHGAKPKAGADGARLDALVFDMGKPESGAQPAFDALSFTLPDALTNYHAQVELEVSDDLSNWETMGYASLSWLANSERQTLTSNRMEFTPRPFRYARLSWREGTPIEFARIMAESPSLTDLPPAPDSVVLKPAPGKFPGDLVYNAAPAIPVRRMNLQFSDQNVVLPAVLGNYVELPALKGTATTRWDFRPRLQATFFQITQDGKLRKSGDVVVDEVHEASWVLRPQSPAPEPGPELKLSWIPATLVFMASGPGPYSMAFGRSGAQPAALDVAQVAPGFSGAELQRLEQAVPGQLRVISVLAAAPSDAAAAGSAARQRMLMLWGVLLLGVGVLGLMAWKLIGQMKNSGQ